MTKEQTLMNELNQIEENLWELPVKTRNEHLKNIYYPQRTALAIKISEELPQVAKLAEYLHNKFCTENHIDSCGWEYEGKDWTGNVHQRYLFEALRCIEEIRNIIIA